jgi:hypothetical protein
LSDHSLGPTDWPLIAESNWFKVATHPFGSNQLGGYFYWTDWRSKSIERVDKATGKQRSVLREGKQTCCNPCSEAYGGCSHL